MREPAQAFTKKWITVPSVCKAMKIVIDKSVTTSVGGVMQNKYFSRYGTQPPKENGPKSNGRGGVHCFAHYPPTWRPMIEKEIMEHKIEFDKQGSLF